MPWQEQHPRDPNDSFDGGDLDCGSGLLLLIRKHLDPLPPGGLLEILSREISVDEDLPAWCRLTGNELISQVKSGNQRSFLIAKANRDEPALTEKRKVDPIPMPTMAKTDEEITIPALAVMGIGSWPRPGWMMRAIHDYLEGRMPEEEFQQTADDAIRLAVAAQERAGVDVVTDGEQRRDSYASFVGSRLRNCQLIPITDLLPYVDDPDHFRAELQALDVPAEKVRHPAVFGPITRDRPLVRHEVDFLRTIASRPCKVALPGPYLLTRTMWLECVSEKVYPEREPLAEAIITALRAELGELLDSGVALIQFDEPVLSEVVFGHARANRSFMCGALTGRGSVDEELAFAQSLITRTLEGFPRERLALHVCRGNWSPDESVALAGDYRPLLPLLSQIPVGTLFLELCTPRAGELEVLRDLPRELHIGVGVVNPKNPEVESDSEIRHRAENAIAQFGLERVYLTPDCGFATFADNPVTAAPIAEAKLAAITRVARQLRGEA